MVLFRRLIHTVTREQEERLINRPILLIPRGSQVFKFTTSKSDAIRPVFSNLEWTIKPGESWAIVGNASEERTVLIEVQTFNLKVTSNDNNQIFTLKSQTRIHPPPPHGLWPFLTATDLNVDPTDHVRTVSFAHRPRVGQGGFYDYSARYGAVREEDRVTLRQYLINACKGDDDGKDRILRLSESVGLDTFLDLPLIALSNGQTRRARIIQALLHQPKVLVLDEPLTGLDLSQRPRLLSLLKAFHQKSQPHIIMTLRVQDPVPDWITHLFYINSHNRIISGLKQHVILQIDSSVTKSQSQPVSTISSSSNKKLGDILINLQSVNVKYHDRHILKNITWTIRQGERWILSGPNGSGKTTLLSLITGDHPQSYTQSPPSSLSLFSKPRRQLATPMLARLIGISSPEIYNAFPRKLDSSGLTVRDTVGTGFEGVFTFRRLTNEQERKVQNLLNELGPAPDKWESSYTTTPFASRLFATLTPGEQSLVLLMRALVNDPQVLILDEAFSGMDNAMSRTVSKYLERHVSSHQAVVWVSHWEDEMPWRGTEAVRWFKLGE
ncbi:hypothetical protein Clacol_002741 [Clathrus columnatus]|uniref:ABC transporter domain-containing protein n=1 Tax=Clathrus columnatus TaxID=1419009 RepID=A0AAV5A4X5_9AGAM|nr:hypothetical protein Clacol_002741 [Clathrus columnatus]